MAKRRDGTYDVGFGKPPVHTRFEKGRSGNPKGRPVGSKNVATIIREAAFERITIIVKGKPRTITKLQAATIQLANKAAQGDLKAMQMLLPQLAALDASIVAAPLEIVAEDDKAVMASLIKRFSPAGTEAPQKTERAPRKSKSKKGRTP